VAEEAAFLYEAFHLLYPSRPQHFGGAGAIPFTEIDAFCRLFAITEERETVARQLRRLDVAYLGLVENRKQRTPSPSVTNGRNHARHPHQPARRP
jgi:hypothetical protein